VTAEELRDYMLEQMLVDPPHPTPFQLFVSTEDDRKPNTCDIVWYDEDWEPDDENPARGSRSSYRFKVTIEPMEPVDD
jgi:hypothetical protein